MLKTFRSTPGPRALITCLIFFAGGCGSEEFEIVDGGAQADSARSDGRSVEGAVVGSDARQNDASNDRSEASAARGAEGAVRSDDAATGDAIRPLDVGVDARGEASFAADVNVTPAVDAAAPLRDSAVDGRATSVAPPADAAPTNDAAPLSVNDATAVRPVPDAAEVPAARDGALAETGMADAGPADVAAEATCSAPRTFYRDRDRDGFGSVVDRLIACEAPLGDDAGAWVTQPGDCRDDLPAVRPDVDSPTMSEERYTGAGYMDPTKPGGISFDLNCDGVEDGDPAMSTEPDCPTLLAGCSGEGYVPVTPQRSGPTLNVYCGSTTVKRCVTSGLLCREELSAVAQPYRCH